jgi:two-component system, chemotaxis family, chemotaxis protein CheY
MSCFTLFSVLAKCETDLVSRKVTNQMILIVDDNENVRRMIRSLIEELDPEVIEAIDGGSAIAAFEQQRPEWVLMDVNMYPMDGLTAMRTILAKDPSAQIVIVSQDQDARTRATALSMGAHAFVGKGNLMELRELVAPKII